MVHRWQSSKQREVMEEYITTPLIPYSGGKIKEVNEKIKTPKIKAPKSLLWADARTLLIAAFIAGAGLGVLAGYFGTIKLVGDARATVVSDIIKIDEAREQPKK